MSVKTLAELKTKFETGDKPTASDFVDLIDSFLHAQLGNFPNPLPAVSGAALLDIGSALPNPLPALDGSALYNINPQEYNVPAGMPVPSYATATTFVLTGDYTVAAATVANRVFLIGRRIRLTIGGVYFNTDVQNAVFAAGTTTVTTTTAMPGSPIQACAVSVITPLEHGGGVSVGTVGLSGLWPGYIRNIGYAPSVNAKALTVARKTQALADHSAYSPGELAFRNRTETVGDYVIRAMTAAHAIVAPSGASFGFTANEAGSIYIYECDNGTIVETGLIKKALLDESRLHNTTAISATADADNVLYTTTAMTDAAVRLTGRIDITTGAIAGEWDNEDTRVTVWTPAMNKTSSVLADFAGSNAAEFIVTATPASPINVKAGDLVHICLTTDCLRNGADFFIKGSVNLSGTAVLETTGIGTNGLPFVIHGTAVSAGQTIEEVHSTIRRVATDGTITSVGCSSYTTLGTAPINKRDHLRVVVIRPNL